MLKWLFPDAFAGDLVCDASGQCFGRGRDLHLLHTCISDHERREGLRRHDAEGWLVVPLDILTTHLPPDCKLSRRCSRTQQVVEFYINGHLVGLQMSGQSYVHLLMARRVSLILDRPGHQPRHFHWVRGRGFREYLQVRSPVPASAPVAGIVRVNGRLLRSRSPSPPTPSRAKRARRVSKR